MDYNANNYFNHNKTIKIIYPSSGEIFNIDASGNENELRELLGAIINVPAALIKGIRDNYNNYYTLSSAVKNPNLITFPNQIFTIVHINTNTYNNNFNMNQINNKAGFLYQSRLVNNNNINYYNLNKGNNNHNFILNKNFGYLDNVNKLFYESKPNNVNMKNYIQRKEYKALADYLYKKNYFDYNQIFILQKLIDMKNQKILGLMKPFIEYNTDYHKLLSMITPIINSYLYTSIDDDDSMNNGNNYKKILDDIEFNFSAQDSKLLYNLLEMENNDIINVFKRYIKEKNKKSLISNLNKLLRSKKYNLRKVSIRNVKSQNSYEKEEKQKNEKMRTSKSQNYGIRGKKKNSTNKDSSKNNISNNNKNKSNNLDNNKKKISKDAIENLSQKIIKYYSKNKNEIYYILSYDLKNISPSEKENLLLNVFELDPNTTKITSKNKKKIEKYYMDFMQNEFNDLGQKYINLYNQLINKNTGPNKEILNCYKNLLQHNDLEKMKNEIKEYLDQKAPEIEENEEEEDEEEEEEEGEGENEENSDEENNNETEKENEEEEGEEGEEGDNSFSSKDNSEEGDQESNTSIMKKNKPGNQKKNENNDDEEEDDNIIKLKFD